MRAYEDCHHFHFISDKTKALCEYGINVRNTRLCGKERCPHYRSVSELLGEFDYDYLKGQKK